MTAGQATTGTVLDRILARTAADLAERRRAAPLGALAARAASLPAPVGLRSALAGAGLDVIAEVKRASPSQGVFPVPVDPPAVAASYLEGGAAAISVLTDGPFFHGSLGDLETVAAVAHARERPAPVLRKDFVVDPYQILEARAHGADAVLLIVAALDDGLLGELLAVARAHRLDALVEVHDEAELGRAVAAGADLIGINNRDLRSFAVDLAVGERLAPLVPAGTTVVGESGIFDAADVGRLAKAGVHAVLVGESLIVAPDRAAAVRALLGGGGG
jgi:indole-3-glycerol phosphate synthase